MNLQPHITFFLVTQFAILLLANTGLARPSGASCSTSECHQKIKSYTNLHKPMKENDCMICHLPGERKSHLPANHPGMEPLSKTKKNDTCFACHDDKTGAGFYVIHKPITQKGCVECHNPHGSQGEKLFKAASVKDLCLSCHEDRKDKPHIGQMVESSKEKMCLNCHVGHYSNEKKLLKSKSGNLCYQCHKDKIKKDAVFMHKPVEEGKCADCHDPHGNSQGKFLKKSYAKGDYTLCMSCHNEEIIKDSKASTGTEFRNGDVNLHYFHVKRQAKNYACNACHEVHGSIQPKLIQSFLSFSEWLAPIHYKKTLNGGSCLSACHSEKKYDRINKIENKAGR